MPICNHCQGTGVISPTSAFSLPMKCYRCAGMGKIDWADLRPGDHVCYIYDDPVVQLDNITRYFAEGLRRKERCVYAYDHHNPAQLDAALAKLGVDVRAEHERGALKYFSKEESYLLGGSFKPATVLQRWKDAMKETLKMGFMGMRGAGEVSWALERPHLCQELINYELLSDLYFLNDQPRLTGVCQYDRKRFPTTVIDGACLSHRLVFQD